MPAAPTTQVTPGIYDFKVRLAEVVPKLRELKGFLQIYGISLVFSILYCWFIIVVLIDRHVETPLGVFWDGSTTNLVVSILSQITATLISSTLKSFLGVLKTVLLARPDGTSFASYVGLGEASGYLTVFQVAAMDWFIAPWCDFRLSLPFLSLAFGSGLKVMATFQYYFVASSVTMPVYAGLMPLNSQLMTPGVVSQADMAMFFELWSSNILSNSRYALEIPLEGCSGDCRSIIMPGGLEAPRQVRKFLNATLLSGGTFDNSETIRINEAKGFILKFDKPDANLAFDLVSDCINGGAPENNGLQICIKQFEQSIDVGWAACPKALWDKKLCNSDTSWKLDAVRSTTRLTAFSQLTTTSYNRRNGSIVDIEIPKGAAPVPIYTNGTDFQTLFRNVLVPREGATDADISNIKSLIYAMTWSHRTYVKSFPDDKDFATTTLRNVLAVPFQHTITAAIFGNYSASERGLEAIVHLDLPDEMITTATGGTSRSIFAVQVWAAWMFIGAEATVHLIVLVGLLWVVLRKEPLPREIELGDIQVVRTVRRTLLRARRPRWRLPIWFMRTEAGLGRVPEGTDLPLLDVVERPDVRDERKNTWQLARMLRGVRVLVPAEDDDVEKRAGLTR